ncbi:MAG: amidase family protein [Rhizobiaceae bacterium]
MDPRYQSAAELGRAIGDGRLDPVELAQTFLDAMDNEDGERQIYARTTRKRAIAQAQAARERARSGARRSALDGVPVSWKDLFDIAGTQAESGTLLLKGRTPQHDCRVARFGEEAGLVCLGKTHQTEFAFSGLGVNPVTATPPNRGLPGHAPGGSSSGAAASLTHGLAALAIGSDTGGSVRIPAAWNNLVGLKTSQGLLSNDGVIPLCSSFDTVGPLARTVEDAALALGALGGGRVALDPVALGELVFIIPDGVLFDQCDAQVARAFENATQRLRKAGARIVEAKMPLVSEMLALGPSLFPYEAWQAWGEAIEKDGALMYPPVRDRFRQGKSVSRESFAEAWLKMLRLRDAFASQRKESEVLLYPTVAILPPEVAALEADAAYFTERNLLALRNTRFVNILGGCALTLPLPETACAIQLAMSGGNDWNLLRAGLSVEKTVAANS